MFCEDSFLCTKKYVLARKPNIPRLHLALISLNCNEYFIRSFIRRTCNPSNILTFKDVVWRIDSSKSCQRLSDVMLLRYKRYTSYLSQIFVQKKVNIMSYYGSGGGGNSYGNNSGGNSGYGGNDRYGDSNRNNRGDRDR